MVKYKYWAITLLFCFIMAFNQAFSQSKVVVKLDTAKITIGDHFHLDIYVTTNGKNVLEWPIFKDSLASGVEVISSSDIDTTKEKNGYKFHRKVTLTSFDSGAHVIPPLKFYEIKEKDSNKLGFISDSLTFIVKNVAVDTTKAIKDIKDVADAPFSLAELWALIKTKEGMIIVGIIVFVILLIIGLYFYWRYKKNRPLFSGIKKNLLKPHEQALLDLEILRREKVWQSGRIKEYYTRLTDILRMYIQNVSTINALEMTTDEILDALQSENFDSEVIRKVKDILAIADLVKFAKMDPLPDEHDRCLQFAINIVELTKPKEIIENKNA